MSAAAEAAVTISQLYQSVHTLVYYLKIHLHLYVQSSLQSSGFCGIAMERTRAVSRLSVRALMNRMFLGMKMGTWMWSGGPDAPAVTGMQYVPLS